jgi:glycosyltransferase involved in cell wall biosynthesis
MKKIEKSNDIPLVSNDIPLVSVVMSVHNSSTYLAESIESILNQTFQYFEFIIINDGSTDRSNEILEKYKQLDDRIYLYHQEQQGLPTALNQGIQLAQGKYIARMDADDISLPERFEKQVDFMEAHPEVGVCGTRVKTIGESGGYINAYPSDDETIRCWLLFGMGLAHPSIFLNKELLQKHNLEYDSSYRYGEDYALWVSASQSFALANIPEVLLLYRLHPQQMGQSYKEELRIESTYRVWSILFDDLNVSFTREELEIHRRLWQWQIKYTEEFIGQTEQWFSKLRKANQKTQVYAEPNLTKYLGDRWFIICEPAKQLGFWLAWRCWRSPLLRVSLERDRRQAFIQECFDIGVEHLKDRLDEWTRYRTIKKIILKSFLKSKDN